MNYQQQQQDEEALILFKDGQQLSIRKSDIAAIQTSTRTARPARIDHGAIRNEQINRGYSMMFFIGASFIFGIVGFFLLAGLIKFLAAPTVIQPAPVEVRCPVFGTCNVK